ncbi:MAG: DNA/RNA non-specific endonuclease [Rikenellaceae bacterium]
MKNNYNAIGGATRRNGISTDEGGHLIPLQAGGTNDIINIIPQSRKVNRGSGSLWYNGEKAATKAAVRGDNVKVIVDIEYDKAGFSMRPTSFKRTQYVNGEYQTVKGKVYNKLHMDNTQEFLN